MAYDLSPNDRFFLNQLIPKWETNKPFDLLSDLKYVFHREKGSNYNEAQFEYTAKTLKAFLEENKFARETKQYIFELLPKANMLMVKGSIEAFEDYQEREKSGYASPLPRPAASNTDQARRRKEAMNMEEHPEPPARTGSTFLLVLTLCVVIALCVYAWKFFND